MSKSPKMPSIKINAESALKLRKTPLPVKESHIHFIRKGVMCGTDERGYPTPKNRSPLEIVLHASEGFIPLWAKDCTLRWKIRQSSLEMYEDPGTAALVVERLMGSAILKWADAAPVKFTKTDDLWDFEIVMMASDYCQNGGCVLARAFFPDAGRHTLVVYPKIFEQSEDEQVETMAHEIGHIFGLRHFFAQVSESMPSVIFGKHKKFSIMNYGADSTMTGNDKSDLKKLYVGAWSGQITEVNGTPIKFMKPFHMSGETAEQSVVMEALPVAAKSQIRAKETITKVSTPSGLNG